MAFGSGSIVEVQPSGSDTANGGGFDPGATFATDLSTATGTNVSPIVSSASYTFVAGDVGHFLFVKSGTSWVPGWYQIASVSGGNATVSAAAGTAVLYNGATALNTANGVATTANASSGTWGIDYSRSNTPRISYTDMVIDGTTNTNFTSAANPVGPNVVGNYISVTSGTGFTVQTVEVVSVSGTTATCDKSLGTLGSTGGNGGLGGALASPGMACGLAATSNIIFIRYDATPYVATSASANISGGVCNLNGGTQSDPAHFVGYDVVRAVLTTDVNRPTYRVGVDNARMLYAGNTNQRINNIIIDNPSAHANSTGIQLDWNNQSVSRCSFLSLGSGLVFTNAGNSARHCYASDCTAKGFGSSGDCSLIGCVASGCVYGFSANASSTGVLWENCIDIDGNTGQSWVVASGCTVKNCISYGLTGTGNSAFQFGSGVTNSSFINCIAVNAAGYGFESGGIYNGSQKLINCAAYNCSSGNVRSPDFDATNNQGFISLTGDPFANASGGDFSLNSTAGAGAACLGAGIPGAFVGLNTTGHPDLGAAQTLGGSTSFPTRARVFTGM